MSAPAGARTVSLDELLEWERGVPERYEYVDGVVRMMVGGTSDHARIVLNIGAALKGRLKATPCFPYVELMKVRTAEAFTYPDVVVTCSEIQRKADTVIDPVMIAEVLSPSTEALARGARWETYRTIPSLRLYLLVSQDHAVVEAFRRGPVGWLPMERIEGLDASVDLPFPGLSLPLMEIYDRTGVYGAG